MRCSNLTICSRRTPAASPGPTSIIGRFGVSLNRGELCQETSKLLPERIRPVLLDGNGLLRPVSPSFGHQRGQQRACGVSSASMISELLI
jgi:hypothetical protein